MQNNEMEIRINHSDDAVRPFDLLGHNDITIHRTVPVHAASRPRTTRHTAHTARHGVRLDVQRTQTNDGPGLS